MTILFMIVTGHCQRSRLYSKPVRSLRPVNNRKYHQCIEINLTNCDTMQHLSAVPYFMLSRRLKNSLKKKERFEITIQVGQGNCQVYGMILEE